MIETRYRVVNKYLSEIRDIETRLFDKTSNMDVKEPIRCVAGQYLDTRNVDGDTFFKSLNFGHLKTFLERGDIVQVWYDTALNKEVPSPYQPQPAQQQDNELTQVLKQEGITVSDLKDMIATFKQMAAASNVSNTQPASAQPQQSQQQPTPEPILPQPQTLVQQPNIPDNNMPQSQPNQNLEQSGTNIAQYGSNLSQNIEEPTKQQVQDMIDSLKEKFNTMPYQKKLSYIKQDCTSIELLEWIQATFKQMAIYNTAVKKYNTLKQN